MFMWEDEPPDKGQLDFGFGPGRVQINVHGGNVTIMIGRDGELHVNQEQTIVQGDWNALDRSLTQYGLSAGDIEDLKAALDSDGNTVGDNTRGWLGRLTEKVADGAITVGIPVVLTLIRGFLGV
jgi:hypothetical protein